MWSSVFRGRVDGPRYSRGLPVACSISLPMPWPLQTRPCRRCRSPHGAVSLPATHTLCAYLSTAAGSRHSQSNRRYPYRCYPSRGSSCPSSWPQPGQPWQSAVSSLLHRQGWCCRRGPAHRVRRYRRQADLSVRVLPARLPDILHQDALCR